MERLQNYDYDIIDHPHEAYDDLFLVRVKLINDSFLCFTKHKHDAKPSTVWISKNDGNGYSNHSHSYEKEYFRTSGFESLSLITLIITLNDCSEFLEKCAIKKAGTCKQSNKCCKCGLTDEYASYSDKYKEVRCYMHCD